MDTRRNIVGLRVGLCGLLVLHHQLFNLPEKKLAKQVWDLYKKVWEKRGGRGGMRKSEREGGEMKGGKRERGRIFG